MDVEVGEVKLENESCYMCEELKEIYGVSKEYRLYRECYLYGVKIGLIKE